MIDLFSAGEKGALYDFYAITGGHGNPVAAVSDLSGNGHTLASAVSASLPTIIEQGPFKGLSFDGVNDALVCASVDLSGASVVTVVAGIRCHGNALGVAVEYGPNPGISPGAFGVYVNNGAPCLGYGIGSGPGNFEFANTDQPAEGRFSLLSVTLKPEAPGANSIRLNRENAARVVAASEGTPAASLFGTSALFVGARQGAEYFARCDLFALLVIGREMTVSELQDAESWVAERMPPNITHQRRHFDMLGTLHRADLETHISTDAYACCEFITDANALRVDSHSTIVGAFPGYPTLAELGVTVNGDHWQTIRHDANGAKTSTIHLPAGTKRVRIINGPQARTGAGLATLGTWISSVSADAPLMTPPGVERLFVYGDSISTGAWAVDAQERAWISLVRDQLGIETAAHAIGSQALWDDCNTQALAKDFADRIARIAPTKIWLAIGTNDFGFGHWTATSFGTAYGQLLDAIRELMPWAEVYAQTPLLRTETGVQAFRDAIAAICATRSWVTLVDGTAIMPLARLPDGLHPDTLGHQMYADYVVSTIQP